MALENTAPQNDELLAHNAAFAAGFADKELPAPPRRGLAIVTCMDARVDPAGLLGLSPGDAHVLRNAGGLVSDDVIRSLILSQRVLETREVWLIHHTRCGLEGFDERPLLDALAQETGERPAFSLGGFADAAANVAEQAAVLRAHRLLSATAVRAFVYDVDTGKLRPIL